MKKRIIAIIVALFLLLTAGCGASKETAGGSVQNATPESLDLADGVYQISVTLSGGSGRASVESPAQLRVENGETVATIVWSSSNYDYMIVDGVRYEPLTTEEFSVFEIPIDGFDYAMPVTADTVAMSEPHEIDYIIRFDSTTLAAVTDGEES